MELINHFGESAGRDRDRAIGWQTVKCSLGAVSGSGLVHRRLRMRLRLRTC